MNSSFQSQLCGPLLVASVLLAISNAWCLDTELPGAEDTGKVSLVRGLVEYAGPGHDDFQRLTRGMRIRMGSTVKTGNDGTAVIVTVPGAVCRISPDSTVIFSTLKPSKRKSRATLDVLDGSVTALIDRDRPGKTDFRIHTPHGVAAARGTVYAVTVNAASATSYAQVAEGKIEVTPSKSPGKVGKSREM